MATSTPVPLAEYLYTTYRPDREWVHGELRERHVGERSHSALQKFFLNFFFGVEEAHGLIAFPELRTQVSLTNFRVPDILVLRNSDPYEDIVTTPPLLCIEILSPEDRMSEMHEKIEEYLAMGVRAVWVIDSRRRTALYADLEGTRPTKVLHLPGTEIRVTLDEAFAELDKLQGRSAP